MGIRIRFGLRFFFGLFTLLCVLIGWRVAVIQRAERPIYLLERAGGDVGYPVRIVAFANPGGPATEPFKRRSYLQKLLFGYRMVDLPESVTFGDRLPDQLIDCDDSHLKQVTTPINRLPSISIVDLSGTRITGASVNTIASMKNLREAWLANTNLEFGDLRDLLNSTQLELIDVSGIELSLEQVETLEGISEGCDVLHLY